MHKSAATAYISLPNARESIHTQEDLLSGDHNAALALFRDTFESSRKDTATFWRCFTAYTIPDVPHNRATATF